MWYFQHFDMHSGISKHYHTMSYFQHFDMYSGISKHFDIQSGIFNTLAYTLEFPNSDTQFCFSTTLMF